MSLYILSLCMPVACIGGILRLLLAFPEPTKCFRTLSYAQRDSRMHIVTLPYAHRDSRMHIVTLSYAHRDTAVRTS